MTRNRFRSVLCWLAMIALALPLAVILPTSTARADVPPGFALKDYPTAQGRFNLTDFVFTPDNKGYFTLGKNGRVGWASLENPADQRTLATLDVLTHQDLGAVSIDLGHRYGQAGVAPSLWIIRIRPDGTPNGQNILAEHPVRLDAAGDPIGLGPERRILQFPNREITHGLDSVVVDKDGTLWISVGDGARFQNMDPKAFDAQRPTEPYGKILHLNADGTGVSTNPDYDRADPNSWQSRSYAKGFRNPFRLRLHPTLGLPMVGDVGWNTTEEHNVIRPGGNYGWPCWEGMNRTPEYATALPECAAVQTLPPIFAYDRAANMGTTAMGGIIYTGTGETVGGYPDSYVGTYFFADYSARRIYTMRMNDTATALVTPPDPAGWGRDGATPVGIPVSLKYAANGDVAYSDFDSGNIRRITYVAGNRAPSATAQYSTTGDGQVAFTVDASDLDNDVLSYRWTFGDGATSTAKEPTHTYSGTGPFSARLEVRDGTAVTAVDVQVYPRNATPTVTLTTPAATKTYVVGEQVQLSASATDVESGPISAINWTSTMVNCRGDFSCTRTPGPTGSGAQFTAPFSVDGDRSSWEITATVTDPVTGAKSSRAWTANPTLRPLTVTNNATAVVNVNGVTGATRQIAVNSAVSLAAPRSANGMTFGGWSDGVSLSSRTLTMPDRDLTIDAHYTSRISQRYESDAAIRALLGAPIGAETGDTAGREQIYERGRMYYSETAGVHEVHGAILATYLSQGGMTRLGVPTSDEIATPDGAGRMNTFAGTAANPAPVIYWKPATGAHLALGAIKAQYDITGATAGVHGYPTNSEVSTPNGLARFNSFENGGIYWSPVTGAHSIYGAIYGKWGRMGWEAGALGLPTTSEAATPNGRARYNHFQGGSIYWSPATGANSVQGMIRTKWAGLGWETSVLGLPTTDELPAAGGRFNNFEGGSIYWSPATGAHEVHGLIRAEWIRRGAERSALGFPTSDEFAVPGGRRSNFQRGYIEWVNGRINVVVR